MHCNFMQTILDFGYRSQLVMYSGSKSRGRVGFGVCFSGSGRVRGSTFRGRPPRVFGVSGIFKVKFRIGWHRGWFGFCFSGSGQVWGSKFRGCPPRVLGPHTSLGGMLAYCRYSVKNAHNVRPVVIHTLWKLYKVYTYKKITFKALELWFICNTKISKC